MSNARHWAREYFTDHPSYNRGRTNERPPEVWANKYQDKIRVICTLCLQDAIGAIATNEEERVSSGENLIPRSNSDIKLSLFNAPPESEHIWIEARGSTMITHLIHACRLQPRDVVARVVARATHEHPEGNTSKRASSLQHATSSAHHQTRQFIQTPSNEIVSPQPCCHYKSHQVPPVIAQWGYQVERPNPMAYSNTHPYHQPASFENRPGSAMGHPDFDAPYQNNRYSGLDQFSGTQPSPSSSLFPHPPHLDPRLAYSVSPAPSHLSGESSVSGRPTKLLRSASGIKRPASTAFNDYERHERPWDVHRQKLFEEKLICVIASANLPFNFVTNPEFLSFCAEFIPQARIPSRKSLTLTVMPRFLHQVQTSNRETARGQQATVQCDGWTGGDNHHLVAFMATTATKVYTVKVYDTTIERKTAENLLVQMREVLKTLERDWEINLIVGDYFKTNEVDFLRYATKANELITWIRSKTALIGLIKKYRESRNKQLLSVIRPVPTRWTAFFLAYRCLLELRPTLLDIFQDQRNDNPEIAALIPRDRAGREKAEAMIKLMDDALFWHALARIKSHLSPLAIAANITQLAHCRLDKVLLTFAALYITYLSLSDAEDREVKASLLESIERRWDQSDQEVFIAAVIINPFLRTSPFKKDATLISTGAVYQLFSNLWKRFYNEDPPESLYEETGDYLRGTGCFSTLDSVITAFKNRAKAKEETPSPLDLYSDITIPNQPPCPLIKLALHLLYICPNSASCERLFSTFGLILTKLRTRLDSQRVVGLAECKLHLRDQSLSMETRKNLRRRVFGAPAELQAQQNQATSTAPPMETDQTNATGTQLQSNSRSTELSSELAESSASTFAPPSVSAALRNLTAKHIALLADHDAAANMFEDSESPRFRASSSGGSYKKRTMSDLFDFTSNSWVSFQQASALGCVEDEMKLYELLDLDADGEFDYDLNDSMDSILTV
ncbi:ribonuclease H-like domain-containing protein [Panaeolus papilionaceus]|nr:ribonuclease H-like domain-containing protein [Panaeolus papilionaceus]